MSVTTPAGTPAPADRPKTSFDFYKDGELTAEIRLTISLVLAARRWRSLLDEKLRPINQSAARMETLSAIMHSPELSPQVDIAKRLRIEGPTLTRMLDSLEKDGLVERIPAPRDRRTKLLKLTEAGETTLKDIFAIADDLRERLLDGHSEDEIEQMNRFFFGLVDRLDSRLGGTV